MSATRDGGPWKHPLVLTGGARNEYGEEVYAHTVEVNIAQPDDMSFEDFLEHLRDELTQTYRDGVEQPDVEYKINVKVRGKQEGINRHEAQAAVNRIVQEAADEGVEYKAQWRSNPVLRRQRRIVWQRQGGATRQEDAGTDEESDEEEEEESDDSEEKEGEEEDEDEDMEDELI